MANELLVRGAGLVAQSEGVGKLAKSKMFSNIGTGLGTGLGKMFQARNREFNRILANQLNKDDLNQDQKDELYDQIEKQRFGYVYLNDRKLRLKAEDNLNKLAESTIDNENKMNDIAIKSQGLSHLLPSNRKDEITTILNNGKTVKLKDNNGNELNGYVKQNDDFSRAFAEARKNKKQEFPWNGKMYHTRTKEEENKESSDQPTGDQNLGDAYLYEHEGQQSTMHPSVAEFYKNYVDQDFYKAEYTDDSDQENDRRTKELGIIDINNLPENLEFVTHEEFVDMINEYAPDDKSQLEFEGHINNIVKDAKNVQPGETPDFNWSVTYDKMKTFEAKGNSKSIWNNPVLGGRVPKEDLIEAIKNNTYQSMGINMTEDDAKSMDPTKDSPITDSDIEAIVDEIINNQPELRSDLLAGYLTNLSQDMYIKSLDKEVLQASRVAGMALMDEQETKAMLARMEQERLSMGNQGGQGNQGDQGNQGNQPIFNPNKGIDQFNVDN